MGFRFRKSVKILPGVRLNFSKKGMGVRVGGKHGGVSVGPSGTYVSTSIPGTGIYYSEKIKSNSKTSTSRSGASAPAAKAPKKRPVSLRAWYLIFAILLFFSGLAAFSSTFTGAFITILIAVAMLIKSGVDYSNLKALQEAQAAKRRTK